MSIMNYNDWFHKYHKYLKGTRDRVTTYNDTKWNTISERYDNLINLMSELLDQQPFNVVGNYTGFQQLTELMERSNYTYADVDRSLCETYKMTLQNAMSNMLVNTHCVVAHYKFNNKHVSHDKYAHYYIIDIPFAQLHFGERDEFVRQKLHAFYETENGYFMPSDRFLSDEISKILGFTLICCVNGFMTDDWYVGISEQGFRVKIGWKYSSDATFTIFKLDESKVCDAVIPKSNFDYYVKSFIPYDNFSADASLEGMKCIVQICDDRIRKNIQSVPNFGYFSKNGLVINQIQSKTLSDLVAYGTTDVRVRVYIIKYLREVPGVYPAVNYFDMMDLKYVYTENGSHVTTSDGNRVLLQNVQTDDHLPVCTPPISLSHDSVNIETHKTVRNAYQIPSELNQLTKTIQQIGRNCNVSNPTLRPNQTLDDWYVENVLNPCLYVYGKLSTLHAQYLKAAILTSLISMDHVEMFEKTANEFLYLSQSNPNYRDIQSRMFDMILDISYYNTFMKKVCEPLKQPPFTTMGSIEYPNYFVSENNPSNRPISEQCFITLRYNTDYDTACWVFDVPKIKHFQGIENVFYIDSNLTGNEIYKFLYLYTDTVDTAETENVKPNDMFAFDFDMFTKEIDKHIGYIRYWDAVNRLFKLSNMYYANNDTLSQIAILSKILKKKIDGDVFLEYASEVNYEPSNTSSDNVYSYDEYSERAPFVINFLFYTLSLYRDNRNRMQSYLMHMITNKKFYPRYADLPVSKLTTDFAKENLNYSVISYSPISLHMDDQSISNLPDTTDVTLYSGLQFPVRTNLFLPVNPDTGVTRYPYVFNVYKSSDKHYLLTDQTVDDTYYIMYHDPRMVMGDHPETVYFRDAKLVELLTVYLSEVYDGINDLVTNYKSRWDQTTAIQSLKHTIERHTNLIQSYLENDHDQFRGQGFDDVVRHFSASVSSNPIYVKLNQIQAQIEGMKGSIFDTTTQTYQNIFQTNQIVMTIIRKTYEQCGFDRNAVSRIRRLYFQMCQLTEKMSLKEYQDWLQTLDCDFISGINGHKHLYDFYADNPDNIPYADSKVQKAVFNFVSSVLLAKAQSSYAQTPIDALISGDIQTAYIDELVAYCDDVIQNHVFELFVMNEIQIDETVQTKPLYAELLIHSSNSHVKWDDMNTNYAFTMKPKFDQTDVGYHITQLIPTCTNVFLDGSDLNVTVKVYDASATLITQFTNVLVTFTKVGNSSDTRSEFSECIGMQTLPLEVQNVHETFDVNLGGTIINERHANMHYELLCGNHFTLLDHTSEYCAPPIESLQGPIDKLYLSCDKLNRLSTIDETCRPLSTMYFRPCEVYHIEPDSDVITSIGGKYFVGQTLYAVTDDYLTIFPIIITAIDHSQQHGMIEAKVDLLHTKWTETHDISTMHKYLTQNIECTIVDDNIRNFLDEYTNSMYEPFITDLIPDEHTIYIGTGAVVTEEDTDNFILINMINHDFNPFTLPELYNVLREEPDDHQVWDEEIRVFKAEASKGVQDMNACAMGIMYRYRAMSYATTEEEKMQLRLEIEDLECKRAYAEAYVARMDRYIKQLETPTTWYNVRAYDDALTYINNGRAHFIRTFQSNIRDLSYTDDVHVRLYDWETKTWIDPSAYTIETNIENGINIDPVNKFETDNVMTTMKITFQDVTFKSKKILIYFSYDASDVFDDITMNDMTCMVRFQSVFSAYEETDTIDPYQFIRIRKHYDENEKYTISTLKPLPIEFDNAGFIFDRPTRSGLYTDGSPIRFCDMHISIANHTYGFEDVDIYIPYLMKDVTVPYTHQELVYTVTENYLNQPLVNGAHVTLISVDNHSDSMFDVVASSVLFEGIVEDDHITIQSSNLSLDTSNTFRCTILPDKLHPMFGGVFTIQVESTSTSEDTIPGWFHLNAYQSDIGYRLIPETVAIVMRDAVIPDSSTIVTLENHYQTDTSHDISSDNDNPDDLFTYYYDKENRVRYPIGHVTNNDPKHRLTIDLTTNTNVETIRSNYIGICRYASQTIPSNGIIDLTGYIPTPITRDRYEFWVNGRYVSDPNQIIILSPTTIQLRNMTSLKNLDVVELVDDHQDNAINHRGPIYVDMDGTTYTSFIQLIKHRANITNQSMQYTFNQDVKSGFDTYLIDTLRHPNNHDYEQNIMEYLTMDTSNDYNVLSNIPTINGTTILNLQTHDLGLMEIPNRMILNQMDSVWKRESLNGITPFKHLSRHIDSNGKNQTIHVKELEDGYEIYFTGLSDQCFTVYISTHSVDDISDRNHVLQIIPMIRSGVRIIVNKSFVNNFIHTTIPNTTPIRIQ